MRHSEEIVEMRKDITYIKERLDNGISQTVTKIYDKLNDIAPKVQENSFWVDKIKWAFVWVAVIGVCGGLVSVAISYAK